MKNFLLACLAIFWCGAATAAPLVSTTIDFLDYVFEYEGPENYYPLEEYERVIRELSENGIGKIYLRVNVCGTTHYPTRVSARYGDNGAFHWYARVPSFRLIETYKHYNPLTETIRLGKKYGMEVWGWESLFDDAGVHFRREDCPPDLLENYDANQGWPLLDPFYRANPDALAERDPRRRISDDELAKINAEARRNPIGKIVFTNRAKFQKSTLTAADIAILTSPDNITYRPLDQPFEFRTTVTEDGFNRFEISGVEIRDPFVKIVGRERFDDKEFSFVIVEQRGQGEVFDVTGRLVRSVWSWLEAPGGKGSLNFEFCSTPAAWDFGFRQLGFVVGEMPTNRYFYGMAEFSVPKAMEHKVARFAELAEYPFDGFMFNIRCHSPLTNPEQYGYNPEVRAEYLRRYGKDIWRDEVDVEKLFAIRAGAVADFLKRCRQLSGERPIYLSGPANPDNTQRAFYGKNFGPLPWLYPRYFSDGSIDGVIMIGDEFADYFTEEVTGGKPIKLGVFREMLFLPRTGYDFDVDMRRLRADPRIDEVELYESRVMSENPELFEIIRGKTPANWDPERKLKW